MLYQLSHVRLSFPGRWSRPGDVLNSSGFPGQHKNAFTQRAGGGCPGSPAPVGHDTMPTLDHVSVLAPLARFGGLGGRTDGRQPAQRTPAVYPDEFHNFAKVRVAGSNPVVRSKQKDQFR